MTYHSDLSQHGNSPVKQQEQIAELQHAIQENTRRLEEVCKKRQQAEQEIIYCKAETRRRMDLTMGKGTTVLALMELGQMLQDERQLSEYLNGQDAEDSNQRNNLQETLEGVTNKAKSLAAEMQEVKEHLAEAKARYMAAQALIQAPTSKSKRKPSKPE